MRAWSELASAMDLAADYNGAWNAMQAAKAIGREHAAAARRHRDRIMPPLLAMARDVTAADFERWTHAALKKPSVPVALLTGLPRSGTTLLQQILAAHSQIVAADEWDAFPRWILPMLLGPVPLDHAGIGWLNALDELKLTRKQHTYLRFLAAALGRSLDGRVLIDKNPSLLPLVPIYRRLFPAGNLIVVLRDPRDVLLSSLMTYFPPNDFSVDFLELRSAAARVAADLNLWLALREKLDGGWMEIRYEALVDDWATAVRPALRQLGLDWQDRILDYRQCSAAVQVNSPSYDAVCQPVDARSRGRWRQYARRLEPVLPQLELLARTLGYET
jgi:hypothetical protein